MYLDAVFSISLKGIEVIKELDSNRKLDYILGIDEDESFTNHMINIGDFGTTSKLFYQLLLSPELNLCELDEKNIEELYLDEYFQILRVNDFMVKSLNKKLQDINLVYIKKLMDEANNVDVHPMRDAYKKYLEFKYLIKEAVSKSADLLLIIRFK